MNHWVEEGVAYWRKGDRSQAERALRFAVEEAPRDVEAWLWLAEVMESDAEKVKALLKALDLDPHNRAARQMLEILQQRKSEEFSHHIHPFTVSEETEPEEPRAEPASVDFSSSLPREDRPRPPSERMNRLVIWLAAAILLLAAVLVVVAVVLPRL